MHLLQLMIFPRFSANTFFSSYVQIQKTEKIYGYDSLGRARKTQQPLKECGVFWTLLLQSMQRLAQPPLFVVLSCALTVDLISTQVGAIPPIQQVAIGLGAVLMQEDGVEIELTLEQGILSLRFEAVLRFFKRSIRALIVFQLGQQHLIGNLIAFNIDSQLLAITLIPLQLYLALHYPLL